MKAGEGFDGPPYDIPSVLASVLFLMFPRRAKPFCVRSSLPAPTTRSPFGRLFAFLSCLLNTKTKPQNDRDYDHDKNDNNDDAMAVDRPTSGRS